jgi:hypothetical protein
MGDLLQPMCTITGNDITITGYSSDQTIGFEDIEILLLKRLVDLLLLVLLTEESLLDYYPIENIYAAAHPQTAATAG